MSRMLHVIRRDRPPTRPPDDGAYDPAATLQWWYFDAVLDDGSRLMTFLLPRFFGSVEGNPAGHPYLDIVLRAPGRGIVRETRSFAPADLAASTTRLRADLAGDCSLAYEPAGPEAPLGTYRLRARAGRIAYDLRIRPDLPPWAPAGGDGRFPRAFLALLRRSLRTRDVFHYVSLVPRGSLGGEITLDGAVHPVGGKAYHEQGRLNFPLGGFVPIWYWMHIEHPPWTILTGTALPPGWMRVRGRVPRGGVALVYEGDRCRIAACDFTGLLADWTRVRSRDPGARDERSMAWEAEVRLRRPGFRMDISVASQEVLAFVPFRYPAPSPTPPYWGQTVVAAQVTVRQGRRRTRFRAEGVLETMATGNLSRK